MGREIEGPHSGDLEALKRRNKSLILSMINQKSPISRSELTHHTDLSKVTITRLVKELLEEEIVREIGLDVSSGGRRPILLELNPDSGFIIGLDVGLDSICAGLTNLKGNILMGVKRKNEVSKTGRELVQRMKEVVDELLSQTDIRSDIRPEKIKGIGVSMPGLIDAKEGVILFGHVVNEKKIPLRALLKEHFTYPIYVDNDANVGVLGERYVGVGKEVKNILYLHVKRHQKDRMSLGCSFVIDGRIYRGASQTSGELGLRVPIEKVGDLKEEDVAGLLPWVIDPSFSEQAVQLVRSGRPSLLKTMVKDDLEAVTFDTVLEAARKKDRVALDVFDQIGHKLGARIAFLVNFLNPELVILGGDIVYSEELILTPVREAVSHLAFEVPAQNVAIRLAEVRGEFGACVGASYLVLSNLLQPIGGF